MNRQPLAAKRGFRSDIVFPIMQHKDCNSPLADMLSLFNNTSIVKGTHRNTPFLRNDVHGIYIYFAGAPTLI